MDYVFTFHLLVSTKSLSQKITYQLQCNFANVSWKSVGKSNWNGPPLRYGVILNNTLVNWTFEVRNYSVTLNISKREFTKLSPHIHHWLNVSACTSTGCFQENTVHCRTLESGNLMFLPQEIEDRRYIGQQVYDPHYYIHTLTNIQLLGLQFPAEISIWSLAVAHVLTRHLLSEIYPPLKINISVDRNCI